MGQATHVVDKKEIELARIKFEQARDGLAEKEKELVDYKRETLKVIRGQSTLNIDLLNSLVSETEGAILQLKEAVSAAEKEYTALLDSADSLRKEYDRLLSWADLYDSCSFEAKKMIVSQLIKAVRVGRDYNIEIDFNVTFTAFQNCCIQDGQPSTLQPLRSCSA